MKLAWPAFALSAFAAFAPAAAFADSAKVSDLVDELRRMQAKVAQGDKAAYAAELNQLKTIGAAIATASPETWKNKREADSLVIYILSGGSLADVAPLLKGDGFIESERSLARGALAYVTNHEADAIALLRETDLTALDARLAGEVAFARSVLETKRDAKAAAGLLDWSRLLAPGGLVEEAALRREIALLAEAKDVSRLAMLTRQYVTRFSASLYAAEFLRDLAGAVVRLGLADDPANYKLVANAVASLPPDGRRAFLLNLARSGIVNARFGVAALAATEALESSKTDSPEAMRARLYLAAGRLFSDGYDAALADLRDFVRIEARPKRRQLVERGETGGDAVAGRSRPQCLQYGKRRRSARRRKGKAQRSRADDRAGAGCASTHVEPRVVDRNRRLAMTAAPAAAPAPAPVAPPPARAASQPSADRFAFATVLDSLPERSGESRRPRRRGTGASLERIAAGTVLARADDSPFAAKRQRALRVSAVRLAGRLDDGGTPASGGQFAFGPLGCGDGAEIRRQRRIYRRWRQGGERGAADRRTRLPPWRLDLAIARASGRGRRLSRRLFAGHGRAGDDLWPAPFRPLQTRWPRRRSPLPRRAPSSQSREPHASRRARRNQA